MTITTQNPFTPNHNTHILQFWFRNSDGEYELIDANFVSDTQQVVCTTDSGVTFKMFSAKNLTITEIATKFVDMLQGGYRLSKGERVQMWKGIRPLQSRATSRQRRFEKRVHTATNGRPTGLQNTSVKSIADCFYIEGTVPSFTKVKNPCEQTFFCPTSRYGDGGAPDEFLHSVHQVKGGSDHKIVTMTYYNYSTDTDHKRYIVVNGSEEISEHTSMRCAKEKVALLEWEKSHSVA